MGKIPLKVRAEIDADPTYKVCALKGLHGHICGGRITMEHALIYAGRQIQEKWAIVPICARGQEVDHYQDAHTMVKELNQWVAFNQATEDNFKPFYKAFPSYLSQRERLNRKYGVWKPAPVQKIQSITESGINYSLLDKK